jgi:hypothetical protein
LRHISALLCDQILAAREAPAFESPDQAEFENLMMATLSGHFGLSNLGPQPMPTSGGPFAPFVEKLSHLPVPMALDP